jgi:hypothetical protein
MQITVEGKIVPASDPALSKLKMKTQPPPQVTSVVRDKATTTRAFKRSQWMIYIWVYGALLAALIFSAGRINSVQAFLAAAGVMGGFGAFVGAFHYFALRKWNRNIDRRMADLPAPGTTLRGDLESLAIGDRSYPWAGLGVEAIDLVHKENRRSNWREADRIRLATPDGPITLDSVGYTNGQELVDLAVKRLWTKLQGVQPAAA